MSLRAAYAESTFPDFLRASKTGGGSHKSLTRCTRNTQIYIFSRRGVHGTPRPYNKYMYHFPYDRAKPYRNVDPLHRPPRQVPTSRPIGAFWPHPTACGLVWAPAEGPGGEGRPHHLGPPPPPWDLGGEGGDRLRWGHIRILYKAPDRLYKAPTNYTKPYKIIQRPQKDYTKT